MKHTRNSLLLATAVIGVAGMAHAQEVFIGEVRLFGFNFCPSGWMAAAGQTLSIKSNQALFSLYGTTYGGNGTTTFALPNLIGRAPTGAGSPPLGAPMGVAYGSSSVALSVANLPPSSPQLYASTATASSPNPTGNVLATSPKGSQAYAPPDTTTLTPLASTAIGPLGSGQPVSIQSPALAMTWCVCVTGDYPTH